MLFLFQFPTCARLLRTIAEKTKKLEMKTNRKEHYLKYEPSDSTINQSDGEKDFFLFWRERMLPSSKEEASSL